MKINIKFYYKYYLEIKARIFLIILSWIFTITICYQYKDFLLFFLINSNNNFLVSNKQLYFIFTNITEIFDVYLNLTFFISNQISFILCLYHTVIFFALSLYKNELKQITGLLKTFIVIWLFSIIINYKVLIPFSWEFFLAFQKQGTLNQPIDFLFEAKLLDFTNYFIKISNLCFFICQFFILAILFLNLNKIEIKKTRKFFYLLFLLFSTIITPPDIVSQIILTSIICLIYEIFIFLKYL